MKTLRRTAILLTSLGTGLLAACSPGHVNTVMPSVAPASLSTDPSDGVSVSWSSTEPLETSGASAAYTVFDGVHALNYVALTPVFAGAGATGFPVSFSVYVAQGDAWVPVQSYVGYPNPYRDDPVIVPFGSTVAGYAVLIVATAMGDGSGTLRLSQLTGGYDAFFDHLVYLGNAGDGAGVEIEGMGSSSYDPGKLGVWNYDLHNPIIQAQDLGNGGARNVYAPNAVYQGNHLWNVYFGGEDGTTDGLTDRISFLTTSDDFNGGSFSPHVLQIDHGDFIDVNNASVVKIDDSHWEMVYTTLSSDLVNKPGYAWSTDGAHWTPTAGSSLLRLAMTGYSDWATADVNGTNVLYFGDGVRHLYWKDQNAAVQLSTSLDGSHYDYVGPLITADQAGAQFAGGCAGVNDMKSFGQDGYLWAFHCNTNKVWIATGSSPTQAAPAQVLFQSTADTPTFTGTWPNQTWTNPESGVDDAIGQALDPFIVSVGLVSDGDRLYGVLYGASDDPSLTTNAIFARWLQHKAVFTNAHTTLSWMNGDGPDKTVLLMVPDQDLETGSLSLYDTDGTSPVLSGPPVTLRRGDHYAYRP